VPVTVTDEKDRFVTNLDSRTSGSSTRAGNRRSSTSPREKPAVVVGFLLDMSNATRLHWQKSRKRRWNWSQPSAGRPQVQRLSDLVCKRAELLVNTTHDSEPIADRIRKLKPGGGAALFDAIYMACTRRSLVQGEPIEPRGSSSSWATGTTRPAARAWRKCWNWRSGTDHHYGVSTRVLWLPTRMGKEISRDSARRRGRVEYPLQQVYTDVSGYLSTPSDEGNYAYKVVRPYAAALARGFSIRSLRWPAR